MPNYSKKSKKKKSANQPYPYQKKQDQSTATQEDLQKDLQKNNPYRNSSYAISANEFEQLPIDEQIEVAFAGRSNAGKSSAINTIVDNQTLCRISKTPGRTQMINFFQLFSADDEENNSRYLVDLPGYGYAKVPLATKEHWQEVLSRYLAERESLKGVVVIMDIRRPMTEYDLIMMDWCLDANMPTHVLLTKMDKLRSGAAKGVLATIRSELKDHYPDATVQLFSSLKKTGIEEVIAKLNSWYFSEA